MDRDCLNVNEVLCKARIDDVFLLGAEQGSVGSSNCINCVDFRRMHSKKELRNDTGPRQVGAAIHGWTIMKLDIGPITEKIAVIIVKNLFRPMLLRLSTPKRKSEISVDYQRLCIHADGSSVPPLKKIGPLLDESRVLAIMANTHMIAERRKKNLLHPYRFVIHLSPSPRYWFP